MGLIDYWEINIEFCFMLRNVILTKDGSHTIEIPEMKVTYHSVHGAIQESMHIFINAGLYSSGRFDRYDPSEDWIGVHHILEVGFGTGLNALLTLIEADKHKNRIYYTAIEPFPLDETEVNQLNYCEQLNQPHYQRLFEKMHQTEWEQMFEITNDFRLTKKRCSLVDLPVDPSMENSFFLIYFDAFAPDVQPELWTKKIFEKLYAMMVPDGILVSYCSKGDVRRAMQDVGFIVEKIPGPPGKKQMIRAKK
jgi:tRNA U34 5-methylaminomethyl-2-thiouridine-forming methyltransferase MnmC